MLKLDAILVGKSAHRDGGFVLTFMVQGQEFKVRVNQVQGAEFLNTVNTIVPPPQVGGTARTVHTTDLKSYVFTIEAVKPAVPVVAAKPATVVPAKPVLVPGKPVHPVQPVQTVKPVEMKPTT